MEIICETALTIADAPRIRAAITTKPTDPSYSLQYVDFHHVTTGSALIQVTHLVSNANPLLREMTLAEMVYEAVDIYKRARADHTPRALVTFVQVALDGSHELVGVKSPDMRDFARLDDPPFASGNTYMISPRTSSAAERAGALAAYATCPEPAGEPRRSATIIMDY